MRDPARIPKVLAALHAFWEKNPDLRLGQIISNLTPNKYHHTIEIDKVAREDEHGKREWEVVTASIPDVYHVEDTEWEKILLDALKET